MSVWSQASSRAGAAAWLLLGSLVAACGHQDGSVGTQLLGAAGANDTASEGALGFLDELAKNQRIWDEQATLPGASTSFGLASPAARDGLLGELRFPGHAEYASADSAGTEFVTQLVTRERFGFGTYRTRLAFDACATNEETILSFLGYFSDALDHDGDGIADDLEISMQVTCSAPNRLYLTVYTDDEETPKLRFRKLSRLVDFTSGATYETPAPDSDQFMATGTDATLVAPGTFTAGTLYELGFEWHADSLRFFSTRNGVEKELWTLTGTERVPQLPVYIMYNLWHPTSHWYPRETAAADFPANDVVMQVDWVSFEPE